jgi:hypothetical protein
MSVPTANPLGSKCCVCGGDARDEAYTAIAWGGLLSRAIHKTAEAEIFEDVEGNMGGAVMRGADALPWSKTPSRTKGLRRNLGHYVLDLWFERAVKGRLPGEARLVRYRLPANGYDHGFRCALFVPWNAGRHYPNLRFSRADASSNISSGLAKQKRAKRVSGALA